MAVRHMFPAKLLLLLAGDWSQISTPPPAGTFGTLLDCCMGGLPTARFCRTALLLAVGNTTMPFELPTAVLASTRLLLPMMPRPKSTAGPVAYPLPLVSFHRNELLLPWIHMPPQAAAGVPFRTATLLSTLIPDDVGPIRIPDMQFVVVVTLCTHPLTVPLNKMPSP